MPLKIIRQDITKMEVDAIVNPTNKYMRPGGGVDAAVHAAAGEELFAYCQTLGGLSLGEAKITPAFNLPCKYVIHTAGPIWKDGLSGERVLLRSCYKESMELAVKNHCRTVAFPLIASGLHGYPKDKVLKEAIEVLSGILKRCEMDVYILVYDKTAYSISNDLYDGVTAFVDNFYVEMNSDVLDNFREERNYARYRDERRMRNETCLEKESADDLACSFRCESYRPDDDLGGLFGDMDKSFAETLFDYIDKKNLSDVDAYKRSNVSRKTFSKIKCDKYYNPSKITAVSFAVGLHLDLDETKHLLSTAGLTLSRSVKFDVIIEYFIRSGKYETIHDVNAVLYQFDQVLLGV